MTPTERALRDERDYYRAQRDRWKARAEAAEADRDQLLRERESTMSSITTITTAPQLADHLNVDAKKLRGWLRKDYPDRAPGQGDEWVLTPDMNRWMAERAGTTLEDEA